MSSFISVSLAFSSAKIGIILMLTLTLILGQSEGARQPFPGQHFYSQHMPALQWAPARAFLWPSSSQPGQELTR